MDDAVRDDHQDQILVLVRLDLHRQSTLNPEQHTSPDSLVQHRLKQRRSRETHRSQRGVVRVQDARHAVERRVLFVAIQREAVRGCLALVETGAEAVGGEETIGVVELEDAADGVNRLLVGVEHAARVEGGIVVMEGGGVGGVSVAAREVDGHHEVEVQTVLDELQEGGSGEEGEGLDAQRATCKRE